MEEFNIRKKLINLVTTRLWIILSHLCESMINYLIILNTEYDSYIWSITEDEPLGIFNITLGKTIFT